MVKEALIKLINEVIPDGAEVVIFDHRKNLNDDVGDGSSTGIYQHFDVVYHTKQEIADGCIPFGALYFNNDDYTEEGEKI
jgi:hypothetical protein